MKTKKAQTNIVVSPGGSYIRQPPGGLRKIANWILFIATIRFVSLSERFVALRFQDYEGNCVDTTLKRAEFKKFTTWKERVESHGFDLPTDGEEAKALHRHLVSQTP